MSDQTLVGGELVCPSVIKAIQSSQVAIIVFSTRCLSFRLMDEVACIMKCMVERGLIVKPIFYDVDPLQMQRDIQMIGASISRFESVKNKEVGSWRNPLMHASNLSGWVPKHCVNRHDSKSIIQIIDTVTFGLLPLKSSSHTNLVGVETRMQDLKLLLEIGAGGVFMLGIWGIGGGGKSTLAFAICKEICHEFDCCCFVENVREESKKKGLEILQETILLKVLKQKRVAVSSIEEGKFLMKSRLCNISVLIVLDDVDDYHQLEALAGSHDWFGKGSRIIITTREKCLLKSHKVDRIYGVDLLNSEEALELFSRHAFGHHRPPEGYDELLEDVVSRVDGLPLALKSLGSFLCNRVLNEWKSAWASSIQYTEIMENLKISYDGLPDSEKKLFLDIACLIDGNLEHVAMTILHARDFYSFQIEFLVDKGLITVSDGVFFMHNMLKEMGLYIVQGGHPNSFKQYSRVWQKEDVLNICAMDSTE
nr:hypothetical protein [Tanacetum cinerariifolium]GFA78244.1 hypothetical protein [Tanacetum cinerariifolium]GFA78246.1 hypothetical protein [Tanacetum cinerariifolium]